MLEDEAEDLACRAFGAVVAILKSSRMSRLLVAFCRWCGRCRLRAGTGTGTTTVPYSNSAPSVSFVVKSGRKSRSLDSKGVLMQAINF